MTNIIDPVEYWPISIEMTVNWTGNWPSQTGQPSPDGRSSCWPRPNWWPQLIGIEWRDPGPVVIIDGQLTDPVLEGPVDLIDPEKAQNPAQAQPRPRPGPGPAQARTGPAQPRRTPRPIGEGGPGQTDPAQPDRRWRADGPSEPDGQWRTDSVTANGRNPDDNDNDPASQWQWQTVIDAMTSGPIDPGSWWPSIDPVNWTDPVIGQLDVDDPGSDPMTLKPNPTRTDSPRQWQTQTVLNGEPNCGQTRTKSQTQLTQWRTDS